MTKIYSRTIALEADILDAFCELQQGFTDQFVYFDKARPNRYMGLGRCIALPYLDEIEYELEGEGAGETGEAQTISGEGAASVKPCGEGAVGSAQAAGNDGAVGSAQATGGSSKTPIHPIFFSFSRFDAQNPAPTDELFEAFPCLGFMLPELVLIENEQGCFLQVNSLSHVYAGRVARFLKQANAAHARTRKTIPYTLEPDSPTNWKCAVDKALCAIKAGRLEKVVLSRRQKLVACETFSSADLRVNLIDGSARGVVLLYRYADVFFCGCTPELLVRKSADEVESMCLAGTCPAGNTEAESERLAHELLADKKNRAEHEYVVHFMREVLSRMCYDVRIPENPRILRLTNVQHLYTPCAARALEGVSIQTLRDALHPTPAVSGAAVGEAKMIIRQIEAFNRGLFAGSAGYVDGAGNGEFSVALRTGVFDGQTGWLYAGCGIVEGSEAASEYAEIDLKLKTILSAFEGE